MTNYSLRSRIIILILAPTLMIGLLLSIFFVVLRYNDLQHQLEEAGASIIEPLAVSSAYNMAPQNHEAIRSMVNTLQRRHADIVRSIGVFDTQSRVLVSTRIQSNSLVIPLPAGENIPEKLRATRNGDKMILRTPILNEEYPLDSTTLRTGGSQGKTLGYITMELDLSSVRLQEYREIFFSTLVIFFCIAMAILSAWHLMRDITSPILNMVNTVDRIRRGQLDSRVEGYMFGELDTLKNGINSMAMSLTAYHAQMQHNIDQATSDLRVTLEQIEGQNIELDQARKRAQEAARIKSEFLANMSHELRTPLNGVIGFTRLALKSELTATQRDHLNTIDRCANNLLSIINDVLDFSKLEAGKLILENIPFALRSTLDEIVTLLAQSAHDKGLELTLGIKNDVPDNVIGDPLRLQQVITNLAGNAIKFTETGNIDLRVEKRSQSNNTVQIEVQIHDTGMGIPEAEQSRLFQAFRQADSSISRSHGGTGLGLVITQRLVAQMEGNISFHSQPNRGSTFWFTLPLELNTHAEQDNQVIKSLPAKRIAYVEPNNAAAQCTLAIFDDTPLSVVSRPTLAALPEDTYDVLLLGIPVTFTEPLSMESPMLAKAASLTKCLILALPCHAQIHAEALKNQGIAACLLKPITATRLFPLLAEHASQQRSTGKSAQKNSKFSLTVMAVDDNPANLKLIGALLEDHVQHVVLCGSGQQALDYACENQVDIILMDIQMPGIDGIRTCELIRQLPQHLRTPIIAVTAHALSGQKEKLLAAGMNDYLAKPILEQKLVNLLRRYQPTQGSSLSFSAAENTRKNQTLDWELALHQAADKPELARDMLQMLLGFLPEAGDIIKQQLAGEQTKELVDIIHKLHGSCSYNGVVHLKNLCNLIEGQLREGVVAQNLEPELLELLDEMENVVREGQRILG